MQNNGNEEGERKSPFSDEALRRIAKEKILWLLGLKIHVMAYVGVNIMLILLNLTVATPDVIWFAYPLSCWLVGLVIHYTVYLIYVRGIMGGNKKGLILAAVSGLMAIQALFVINYVSDFTIVWFFWPTGAIIVGIIVYGFVYLSIVKAKQAKEDGKTWMDKKIDNELKKVKRTEA